MSTLLQPDQPATEIEPLHGPEYELEEVQHLVGGLVEAIQLPDGLLMLINEEGRLYNLPINPEATRLYRLAYPGSPWPIVGPALICRLEEFP